MQNQMAHVIGVPKREPCQKCNLPIFLAERLTFGRHLYHRTCLKCARCQSQLTPGSFYETEIDGEFCCETCPDEEKDRLDAGCASDEAASSVNILSSVQNTISTDGRVSFNEKLAIFQNNGKGLLHKSLSDEEKSKSLKRLALFNSLQTDCDSSAYKTNSALSSFMTSQVVGDDSDGSSADEEEDIDDDEEDPPMLPTTKPPLISEPDTTASVSIADNISPSILLLTSSPQSSESHTTCVITTDNPEKSVKIEPILAPTQHELHSEFSYKELDNLNEVRASSEPEALPDKPELLPKPVTVAALPVRMETPTHIDSTVNLEVLAEPVALRIKPKVLIEEESIQSLGGDDRSNVTKEDTKETGGHHVAEPDRTSMVRSRLQQFEQTFAAADQKTSSSNSSIVSKSRLISNIEKERSSTTRSKESENEIKPHQIASVLQSVSILPDANVNKPTIEPTLDSIQLYDSGYENSVESTVKEVSIKLDLKNDIVDSIVGNTDDDKTKKAVEPPEAAHPTPTKRMSKLRHFNIETDNTLEKPKIKLRTTLNNELTEVEGIAIPSVDIIPSTPFESTTTVEEQQYPLQLNPFGSDDENDEEQEAMETTQPAKMINISDVQHNPAKRNSFNPFDSSDDEIELEKSGTIKAAPKAISMNPFGSDTDEDDENLAASKRTPVPTPRKNVAGGTSLNTTPEPTPRMSRTLHHHHHQQQLRHDLTPSHLLMKSYDSETSLMRNHYLHGSTNSLASSTSSSHNAYTRRRKGRAPLPPGVITSPVSSLLNHEQLTRSTNELDRSQHSPTPSIRPSPTSTRKKRPAPAPPRAMALPPSCSTPRPPLPSDSNLEISQYVTAVSELSNQSADVEFSNISVVDTMPTESPPEQPIDLSLDTSLDCSPILPEDTDSSLPTSHVRKVIPLDDSLISDSEASPKIERKADVVYRRTIVPSVVVSDDSTTPTDDKASAFDDDAESHARQWQKVKENKESQNKNRQSQISLSSPTAHSPDSDGGGTVYSNKSTFGKWKRRKGPAPALPIPPRKILQMVPLQEIRHELEVIEVQQQGLEKQGIMLEKMIRERCEGSELPIDEQGQPKILPNTVNTKEVEDLILQLFEIVNEKNELFRRQAELMYLRRLHRLEQEQADIEYEIRVLMAQPERNKTDSDKAREEGLIARKVEIVLQRNEVIDCLETDRLREAEEDQSIKLRLEMHNAKRDEELGQQTPTKLSKKEKKKQRESKKLTKQKKMDADKDADESESPVAAVVEKKKKRKFLF